MIRLVRYAGPPACSHTHVFTSFSSASMLAGICFITTQEEGREDQTGEGMRAVGGAPRVGTRSGGRAAGAGSR